MRTLGKAQGVVLVALLILLTLRDGTRLCAEWQRSKCPHQREKRTQPFDPLGMHRILRMGPQFTNWSDGISHDGLRDS